MENKSFKSLSYTWSLLTKGEKKNIVLLMILTFINGIMQAMNVVSVFPFIAIVAKPEVIHTNPTLSWLYAKLGMASTFDFLVFIGISIFLFILFTNLFQIFSIYKQKSFVKKFTVAFISRYFRLHLEQPYTYYIQSNTSDISKKILEDSRNITEKYFNYLFQFVTGLFISLFLLMVILLADVYLSLSIITIIFLFYFSIYRITRRRLKFYSELKLQVLKKLHRTLAETFGAIKDIKVAGSENVFKKIYKTTLEKFSKSQFFLQMLSGTPHYVMDIFTMGGIILIILYLLFSKGDLEQSLPLLALFGLAAQRIKPQAQVAFNAWANMGFIRPSLEVVLNDFKRLSYSDESEHELHDNSPFRHLENISVKDLSFTYPGKDIKVIKDLNLDIEANKTIALVGSSGSGKTTLVDLILGILSPESGAVLVNGRELGRENINEWKECIGYIPQNIFIFDDSIARNIAFTTREESINPARIMELLQLVKMDEWLKEQPDGLNTVLGDKGIRLSGGQRQRIGIARALYRNPSLLVMDEATSALDGITEEHVMESIYNLSGKLTIIMIAHRLTTVKNCDTIHFMAAGNIVQSGTYSELIAGNEEFRAMAKETLAPDLSV